MVYKAAVFMFNSGRGTRYADIQKRLTEWFQFRNKEANTTFFHHLLSTFKDNGDDIRIVFLSPTGRHIQSLQQVQQILSRHYSTVNWQENTQTPDNRLFDQHNPVCTIFPVHCPYCGQCHCNLPHEKLKLLEIWHKRTAWTLLGNDLAISKPQQTSTHSGKQTLTLMFVIAFRSRLIYYFNCKDRVLVRPPLLVPQSFLDTFQWNKCVLPMSVWISRCLWTNNCDIEQLPQVLPEPLMCDLQDLCDTHQHLTSLASLVRLL